MIPKMLFQQLLADKCLRQLIIMAKERPTKPNPTRGGEKEGDLTLYSPIGRKALRYISWTLAQKMNTEFLGNFSFTLRALFAVKALDRNFTVNALDSFGCNNQALIQTQDQNQNHTHRK